MITLIRRISPRQALVKHEDNFYVVSQSIDGWSPVETLVFRSNSGGEVTDWGEITGEVGVGLESYLERILCEGKFDGHMDPEM